MSPPKVLSFATASVYEIRGNGGWTASSGFTSRSSSASSGFRRSRQRATIAETNSSCNRMLASESFHATWLDHPEFGQVAPGLRFLRPKRGSEAVHLAERGGGGLHVELPSLREVRGAQV